MSYRTLGCLGRKECWGVGVEVGRTVARARVKAVTLAGRNTFEISLAGRVNRVG